MRAIQSVLQVSISLWYQTSQTIAGYDEGIFNLINVFQITRKNLKVVNSS